MIEACLFLFLLEISTFESRLKLNYNILLPFDNGRYAPPEGEMQASFVAIGLVAVLSTRNVTAYNNGLARTPPMVKFNVL